MAQIFSSMISGGFLGLGNNYAAAEPEPEDMEAEAECEENRQDGADDGENSPAATVNLPPPEQSENPTLDLEMYASNYEGYSRIIRLQYVVAQCPSLKRDALHLLMNYLQDNTMNVEAYQDAQNKLKTLSSTATAKRYTPDIINNTSNNNDTDAKSWVEKTQRAASTKLDRLDRELKHYKSNSIKESIRRGQDDLGEHYLDMGNLTEALKCFSRARDYCTTPKHQLQTYFNVIRTSIYLANWSLVQSYVQRAEQILPSTLETSTGGAASQSNRQDSQKKNQHAARLKASSGLADLANSKYKSAAKNFLQATFEHLNWPRVLSNNDIAIYASLCSLATFDRTELQKLVINNSNFKQFLELEPQLADVIRKFNTSQYESCLRLLEEMRQNLLLNCYLAPHLKKLMVRIRKRALVQYFSPYLSAEMRPMALTFGASVEELENELAELILDGQLQARIDSHNKLLVAEDVDQRASAYEKALEAGKKMENYIRATMIRAAMYRAGISIQAGTKNQQQQQLKPDSSQAVAIGSSSSKQGMENVAEYETQPSPPRMGQEVGSTTGGSDLSHQEEGDNSGSGLPSPLPSAPIIAEEEEDSTTPHPDNTATPTDSGQSSPQ